MNTGKKCRQQLGGRSLQLRSQTSATGIGLIGLLACGVVQKKSSLASSSGQKDDLVLTVFDENSSCPR